MPIYVELLKIDLLDEAELHELPQEQITQIIQSNYFGMISTLLK
jgi:hypothetical protein